MCVQNQDTYTVTKQLNIVVCYKDPEGKAKLRGRINLEMILYLNF